jgi:very-short-patch-repair endonuclease
VSFAPLPVFVRGGKDYRRIEPDFIVVKGGMVAVIEVDGDTVHQESPVEAHARTTMLVHEGAHVERVRASECDTPEKAKECAERVLASLAKVRASR